MANLTSLAGYTRAAASSRTCFAVARGRSSGATPGLPTPARWSRETALLRRTASFAHVDDRERVAAYTHLLTTDARYDTLGARDQRFARMLFFCFWRNGGGYSSYQQGLDVLRAHPAVCLEVAELLALGLARAEHVTRPLEAGLQDVTLRTDAHYSLEEVLAALDYCSFERLPSSFREGVLWVEEHKTDAFFVTLRKSEQDYSPTTMYKDYAMSPELFHWESQNRTSTTSSVGRRYLDQRRAVPTCSCWSARPSEPWGGTQTYTCLGPATYVSHTANKPIAITYRLRHAMTADGFRRASLTG